MKLTSHGLDVDSAAVSSVLQNQLLQVKKCLLVVTLQGTEDAKKSHLMHMFQDPEINTKKKKVDKQKISF